MAQESLTISISGEALTVEQKLESLPAGPGVYQHKDAAGTVLYVGKAKNLRTRVRQYFQRSRAMDPRIEAMLRKATDLEIIVTGSEVEALINTALSYNPSDRFPTAEAMKDALLGVARQTGGPESLDHRREQSWGDGEVIRGASGVPPARRSIASVSYTPLPA